MASLDEEVIHVETNHTNGIWFWKAELGVQTGSWYIYGRESSQDRSWSILSKVLCHYEGLIINVNILQKPLLPFFFSSQQTGSCQEE